MPTSEWTEIVDDPTDARTGNVADCDDVALALEQAVGDLVLTHSPSSSSSDCGSDKSGGVFDSTGTPVLALEDSDAENVNWDDMSAQSFSSADAYDDSDFLGDGADEEDSIVLAVPAPSGAQERTEPKIDFSTLPMYMSSPNITLISADMLTDIVHAIVDREVRQRLRTNKDTTHASVFKLLMADSRTVLKALVLDWISSIVTRGESPEAAPSTSPQAIDSDASDEAAHLVMLQKTCCICEMDDQQCVLLRCQHAVCIDCWKQQISVYLSDESARGFNLTPYELKCPCLHCTARLGNPAFRRLVLEDKKLRALYARLLRNKLQYALQSDALKFCHNPLCTTAAYFKATESDGTPCANVACDCGYQWCFSCDNHALGNHFPFTCSQVQALSSFGQQIRKASWDKFELVNIAINTMGSAAQMHKPLPPSLQDVMFLSDARDAPIDFGKIDSKVCPRCKTNILYKPESSRVVFCGGRRDIGCGFSCCWFCEESWPSLGHACVHEKIGFDYCEDTQYIQSLRACPQCGIVVERNGGCTSVQCQCETRFCWNCLEYPRAFCACNPLSKATEEARRRNQIQVRAYLTDYSSLNVRDQPMLLRLLHSTTTSSLIDFRRISIIAWNLLRWASLYAKVFSWLIPQHPNPMLHFVIDRNLALLRDEMQHATEWSYVINSAAKLLSRVSTILSLLDELRTPTS